VRRRVWRRDEGQCAFVGTQGRCTEHGFLEFHHVVPYADGGDSVFENLELRCRLCRYRHNAGRTMRTRPIAGRGRYSRRKLTGRSGRNQSHTARSWTECAEGCLASILQPTATGAILNRRD
jgi:hypothetical protein